MSIKNKVQPKTNVKMSKKNNGQQKTNVNKKQILTKKISTKNKCQLKTINLTKLNPT